MAFPFTERFHLLIWAWIPKSCFWMAGIVLEHHGPPQNVLMMHHEYSWCIMSTHDAPWVFMIMSTHDASWVLLMPIIAASCEYPWCIMSAHDASDLSPNGTPWKLRGFQPNQSRWSFCARLCKFRDLQVPTFFLFGFLLFFMPFWKDPRAPIDHSVTIADQFGCSLWLQVPFCVEVTFQEIKNPENLRLSVSCDSFLLKSGQSMQNRRPVIFNHPFISKTQDVQPRLPLCYLNLTKPETSRKTPMRNHPSDPRLTIEARGCATAAASGSAIITRIPPMAR